MPFDYGFSFAGHRAIAHNLSLGPVEDLSIAVYDRADGGPLRIDFDGNPALHSAADLAGHLQRFLRLLTRAGRCRSPDRQSRHSGAGRARHDPAALERHRAADRSRRRLPELFAAQAARTPDAVAVIFEDAHAQLCGARRATPTGWRIICRASGVGPETVVGLCVERSPEMLVGLLGILKAGGAYLPLDPAIRRAAGVHAGRCRRAVLVTQAALLERLPGSVACTHCPARCRLAGDRAPARHRAAARRSIRATPPMSSTPRARPERRKASSSSMRASPTRCWRSVADFDVESRFRSALVDFLLRSTPRSSRCCCL